MSWKNVMYNARKTGRTTAMIEAVKKLGGILVVRDKREAKRIKTESGIDAVSIDESDKAIGQTRPILFDPDAVGLMCLEYESALAKAAPK